MGAHEAGINMDAPVHRAERRFLPSGLSCPALRFSPWAMGRPSSPPSTNARTSREIL
ncbi:protein of unknown function [Rhodovastum atsumiense]|nr:protein of unknown function [Rhodovastum atsumiense]